MCETPFLVPTQRTGLKEVAPQESVAKNYTHMTAKGIMNVYLGHPFCITIARVDTAEARPPIQQKDGAFSIAPEDIVHVEEERVSYLLAEKRLEVTDL